MLRNGNNLIKPTQVVNKMQADLAIIMVIVITARKVCLGLLVTLIIFPNDLMMIMAVVVLSYPIPLAPI